MGEEWSVVFPFLLPSFSLHTWYRYVTGDCMLKGMHKTCALEVEGDVSSTTRVWTGRWLLTPPGWSIWKRAWKHHFLGIIENISVLDIRSRCCVYRSDYAEHPSGAASDWTGAPNSAKKGNASCQPPSYPFSFWKRKRIQKCKVNQCATTQARAHCSEADHNSHTWAGDGAAFEQLAEERKRKRKEII